METGMTTTDRVGGLLDFVAEHQTDARVAPLLEGLAVQYRARYGGDARQRHGELLAYPAEFEAPDGALTMAMPNKMPVAGAALRRYDSTTAELKRIWGYTSLQDQSLSSGEIGGHLFEKC
jgi:hypothetical protein